MSRTALTIPYFCVTDESVAWRGMVLSARDCRASEPYHAYACWHRQRKRVCQPHHRYQDSRPCEFQCVLQNSAAGERPNASIASTEKRRFHADADGWSFYPLVGRGGRAR